MSSTNPQKRFEDPVCQRRLEVIHESQMHADAVEIYLLTKTLKSLVNDFVSEYTWDTATELFWQAECAVPSDITESGFDRERNWSSWIYGDVLGFQWALGMFNSALSGNLCTPDDDAAPEFVSGEGGA